MPRPRPQAGPPPYSRGRTEPLRLLFGVKYQTSLLVNGFSFRKALGLDGVRGQEGAGGVAPGGPQGRALRCKPAWPWVSPRGPQWPCGCCFLGACQLPFFMSRNQKRVLVGFDAALGPWKRVCLCVGVFN